MANLSPGRAILGLTLTFGGAFLTAFAYSWGHPPLPDDTATIGQLGAHISRCAVAGVNAAMLALPGWLTGWAIRSTHDGKLLVWHKDEEGEEEQAADAPAPRNWTPVPSEPVTMSAKIDRPTDRDEELARQIVAMLKEKRSG